MEKHRLGAKMAGLERWSSDDKEFQLYSGLDAADMGYESEVRGTGSGTRRGGTPVGAGAASRGWRLAARCGRQGSGRGSMAKGRGSMPFRAAAWQQVALIQACCSLRSTPLNLLTPRAHCARALG